MKIQTTNAPNGPRLKPIARSYNPLVWFAALTYRLTLGHVATPLRVVYARAPLLLIGHLTVMAAAEYLVSLDRRTRTVIRVYGSRVNNCMYCEDLETHLALKHKLLTHEDLDAMSKLARGSVAFADAGPFTERETVAMRFVEEVNTVRVASDETFAALRTHFTEREIVEITWINAVNNYLNLQAKPLGLVSEGHCPVDPSVDAREPTQGAPHNA